jgi:heme exporter protein CcmD
MDHTGYIVAAYAITGLAVGWLAISSLLAMKRSEALAKDLSQRD